MQIEAVKVVVVVFVVVFVVVGQSSDLSNSWRRRSHS
jgi:hypothetical protein